MFTFRWLGVNENLRMNFDLRCLAADAYPGAVPHCAEAKGVRLGRLSCKDALWTALRALQTHNYPIKNGHLTR